MSAARLPKRLWTHAVETAVSPEWAWRRLSDIRAGRWAPDDAPLALHSGETLTGAEAVELVGGPGRFAVTVTRKSGEVGRCTLEVNAPVRSVAVQGEWWFRGELRVEPAALDRSRLVLEVFNVAPGWGRHLAPLVARGVRARTRADLEAIAARLQAEGTVTASAS
ncbi:MAG: SRPBCC family protein [Myxococcaceae bacterium]|nr:SRPBCC family protein [Myxococcaceae bacterium]